MDDQVFQKTVLQKLDGLEVKVEGLYGHTEELARDVKGLYGHTEELAHNYGVSQMSYKHLYGWVSKIAGDVEILKEKTT
ncbi:MAG: hypothetical protein Q8P95_00040 [bacterium]|nr:hypothetical protein [bacterium]